MAEFKHVTAVEVLLFDEPVGVVSINPHGRAWYAFEYYPEWVKNGVSISPIHLPLEYGVKTFENLDEGTYRRLPAAIADALPDRFGNSLINAKLSEKGVTAEEITALDRLSYASDRAMGALSFRPARHLGREFDGILEIAELVSAARNAIRGSIATGSQARKALRHLLSVGVSAGGARPKAVVNLSPDTGEMTSGQHPEKGKESWLIKFDGVDAGGEFGETRDYGRIEYAYSLMARAAGINMPDTKLLEENGRAHFMIRRFDRTDDGGKLHMQSLCAMDHVDFNLLHTNDYSSLIAAAKKLGLGDDALTEIYRRMVFNYAAGNCDDHSKNHSFLMDERGHWSLAPAYDITFAYNSQNIWLKEHLLGVSGKFADLSKKDLIDVAETHGIMYAKRTIDEVKNAVSDWAVYAAKAGISKENTARIKQKLQE
jgi:serine/threonine-protein kinase HipA